MFARISEDNVAFSLKVNAPRIPVVLGGPPEGGNVPPRVGK